MTLTPAYGRDYKSKAAIASDLLNGSDFILNHYTGATIAINLPQIDDGNMYPINVRYAKLAKVCVFNTRKDIDKAAAKST